MNDGPGTMTAGGEPAAGVVPDFRAMPTDELLEVRSSARRLREWTTRRDAAVAAAHRAGHSLREIAAEAELSHSGVRRILDRELAK